MSTSRTGIRPDEPRILRQECVIRLPTPEEWVCATLMEQAAQAMKLAANAAMDEVPETAFRRFDVVLNSIPWFRIWIESCGLLCVGTLTKIPLTYSSRHSVGEIPRWSSPGISPGRKPRPYFMNWRRSKPRHHPFRRRISLDNPRGSHATIRPDD